MHWGETEWEPLETMRKSTNFLERSSSVPEELVRRSQTLVFPPRWLLHILIGILNENPCVAQAGITERQIYFGFLPHEVYESSLCAFFFAIFVDREENSTLTVQRLHVSFVGHELFFWGFRYQGRACSPWSPSPGPEPNGPGSEPEVPRARCPRVSHYPRLQLASQVFGLGSC